jgi:tetratricopeptide (TPR) repeat protein
VIRLAAALLALAGAAQAAEIIADADALLVGRKLDEARALYLQAEQECHVLRRAACEMQAQRGLGYVALYAGDTGMASQAFGRALERAVVAGDVASEAKAVLGLGQTALARRGPHMASLLFDHAAAMFRSVGDRAGEAAAWRGLGDAARDDARSTDAAVAYRRALGLDPSLATEIEPRLEALRSR